MKSFTVGKNDAGQRLDRFIAKCAPVLPSSLLQKYLRTKHFRVNGKHVPADTRLREGDTVAMYIEDRFFIRGRDMDDHQKITAPKLDILYEDENIILVNKEPGVLCHSDGGWSYTTLIARIQAYLRIKGEWDPEKENAFAPALCNRIDRNTGGIVIAAKTAEALRIMDDMIKDRRIGKYYLCIVLGRPKPQSGTLEDYLFKDAAKNRVYVRKSPEKGARTAVTRYRTLASKGSLSLVECELITGRTHQIRAQMAAAGWPLLGDGKYGQLRKSQQYGDETGQALWSYKCVFDFQGQGGALSYLEGKTVRARNIPFVEKYFPDATV